LSLPVIVTRSEPGADETARLVTARGFRAIRSPMLRIVETGLDPGALGGVRHLIFTSVNGVHAVGGAPVPAGIRAWCVGPSTAAAARAAGFEHVHEGAGNASDLAGLILAAFPQGPLLHVANEDAAGTLVATLRAAGCDARFAAPYRTEAEPRLSDGALAALSGSGPAALLVHSAKAAAAIAASDPDLARAAVIAISSAALAPLKGRAGLGEWIAGTPDDAAVIAALMDAAAGLRG